jgi:hypothetical protein
MAERQQLFSSEGYFLLQALLGMHPNVAPPSAKKKPVSKIRY